MTVLTGPLPPGETDPAGTDESNLEDQWAKDLGPLKDNFTPLKNLTGGLFITFSNGLAPVQQQAVLEEIEAVLEALKLLGCSIPEEPNKIFIYNTRTEYAKLLSSMGDNEILATTSNGLTQSGTGNILASGITLTTAAHEIVHKLLGHDFGFLDLFARWFNEGLAAALPLSTVTQSFKVPPTASTPGVLGGPVITATTPTSTQSVGAQLQSGKLSITEAIFQAMLGSAKEWYSSGISITNQNYGISAGIILFTLSECKLGEYLQTLKAQEDEIARAYTDAKNPLDPTQADEIVRFRLLQILLEVLGLTFEEFTSELFGFLTSIGETVEQSDHSSTTLEDSFEERKKLIRGSTVGVFQIPDLTPPPTTPPVLTPPVTTT